YMQILNPHAIKLRVWERGAGETLACGTGACAAVVSGIRRNLLQSPVEVSMHGGTLKISWDGDGKAVLMTGPAIAVFEGEINL
ncbi:MAG TPA: diaminopimelate epimerase, partial [Candidatus Paceibacterota bacterium]